MVAVRHLKRWAEEIEVVVQRKAPRFSRADLRQQAEDYLRGLLSRAPRKNSWQLAEELGHDGRGRAEARVASPNPFRLRTCSISSREPVGVPTKFGTTSACRSSNSLATTPELAQQMIRHAVAAGVRCRWVTADEVYGGDSKFRRLVEAQGLSYVVAVSWQQKLWSMADFRQHRVEAYADELPEDHWQEFSCGSGTKGERVYRWALMQFGAWTEGADGVQYQRGLLVREACDTRERAYHFSYAPVETSLPKLVEVAGVVGPSRNVLSRPNRRPGWTSTRFARGRAGTVTSRCRCWPWPSWR